MILERPLFVARTSVESDRWNRRESFFPRTFGPEVTGLCSVWLHEHQLAFSGQAYRGWGRGELLFPFHSISWFLIPSQADSLPRWWMDVALSRVFQILSSSLGSYKQVFKVSFNQILLKDSRGYYAKISFVKSEVVI